MQCFRQFIHTFIDRPYNVESSYVTPDVIGRFLRTARVILGVIDLSTHNVETPDMVAARIGRALPYVKAERIVVAPDCGMKYLPRGIAFEKMNAMVDGARIVRKELGGGE